jgi:hypothetical protein
MLTGAKLAYHSLSEDFQDCLMGTQVITLPMQVILWKASPEYGIKATIVVVTRKHYPPVYLPCE